jgi:hypothetical protein
MYKGKGKGHPRTGHEVPKEEYRYSYTLSLTFVLDEVGGQRQAPAALPPGKTPYPLYMRLGGLQGWSGRMQKISTPPGFDPRTVQPVSSRYTEKYRCVSKFTMKHASLSKGNQQPFGILCRIVW